MITSPMKCVFAAVALSLSATQVGAQAFPSKPIRIIVGFAAGGSTDKLARVIGLRMAEVLGQPVVIDNRPGAAGNIASEAAASAPPDGYTLFMATLSSQAINPHLYAKIKFDPLKSFQPIGMVAKYPLLLVVSPQLQVNSVQELVAYAKSNSGRIFYASSGNGSPAHLAGELFKDASSVDVSHVPYKGGGPAMLALMSNEAQFGFETIPSAIGHARGGKLKALAVTSDKRSVAAPDLPTMQEAGIKNFSVTSWAGLLAPAGTPKAIVDKLAQATQATLETPSVKTALVNDGAEPGGGTPEQFASFMASELKSWGEVVRSANVKLD